VSEELSVEASSQNLFAPRHVSAWHRLSYMSETDCQAGLLAGLVWPEFLDNSGLVFLANGDFLC
jgi:hypothetical protein